MSENDSDADRFFKEAEAFFYRLASERGLGLALGRWNHPKYGALIVRAVFGQVGTLYVTLVFCATDAWLDIGQGRLWWYLNDQFDPFEFKHIAQRPPMAETIINGDSDLEDEIGTRLRWLETRASIEEAVWGVYGNALTVLSKAREAAADPENEPPADDPKKDEPS